MAEEILFRGGDRRCAPAPGAEAAHRTGPRQKRVVITPTQMMESMIENHIPTRAEIFGGTNGTKIVRVGELVPESV